MFPCSALVLYLLSLCYMYHAHDDCRDRSNENDRQKRRCVDLSYHPVLLVLCARARRQRLQCKTRERLFLGIGGRGQLVEREEERFGERGERLDRVLQHRERHARLDGNRRLLHPLPGLRTNAVGAGQDLAV